MTRTVSRTDFHETLLIECVAVFNPARKSEPIDLDDKKISGAMHGK